MRPLLHISNQEMVRSTSSSNAALLNLCALFFVIHGVRGARLSGDAPIKTLQTADGDIFDCVDINKQPAFDHPLLKDHKIQLAPTSYPKEVSSEDMESSMSLSFEIEGGGCPEGTVPIHRVRTDGSMQANSSVPIFHQLDGEPSSVKGMRASVRSNAGKYLGASADINVYGVDPVGQYQMSSALLWVVHRDAPSPKQGMLNAGWMSQPLIFGDTKTRLFIMWTADHGKTTCYNTRCPGFVQVSKNRPLGMALSPLSTYKGNQYVLRTFIYIDQVTKNWWFSFGNPTSFVGYWPKELFYNFDHASEVNYGGYVACPSDEKCPPMGNGRHPAVDPDASCYVERVVYLDTTYNWQDLQPGQQSSSMDIPGCYGVGSYQYWGPTIRYRFGFGGPVCSQ